MSDDDNKPKLPPEMGMPFSERSLGPVLYKRDESFFKARDALFVKPAIWFRENIVERFRREPEPWYHRRFRRVPTIDECYINDFICREEANDQMERDKEVEQGILLILNDRWKDCLRFRGMDADYDNPEDPCEKMRRTHLKAAANFYIKYGDLPYLSRAEDVLMKQKHRLVWERRHGKLPSVQGLDL